MSLKQTLSQFSRELYCYGIILRGITINGLPAFKRSLNEKIRLLQNGELFFYSDDCIGFKIKDDPWRLEYNHDPEMCEEYFFGWRPAFKAIHDLFPSPVGAEVGVFEGFLTHQVLKYVKPSKYFLVDPHLKYDDGIGELGRFTQEMWDEIHNSLCFKYKDNPIVEVVRKTSVDGAEGTPDASLDFVYIDADHRAEAVYKDICAWYPKVKVGGIVSGHDFTEHPVKSGVYRFMVEKTKEVRERDEDFLINLYSATNDWWFKKEC